jgi:hypothetical protein
MQDQQYQGVNFSNSLLLINSPIRTVKSYDAHNLSAGYEIVFSNNPNISGSVITSQTIEFEIDSYNRVEATHLYEFTASKILNNNSIFATLVNNAKSTTQGIVGSYYNAPAFSIVKSEFANLNLTKMSTVWPNIKTKGSVKFSYSNNPSYFVQTDGLTFNYLDSTIENKKPTDLVNEFKVVNRPSRMSVLSYSYQNEKGEIVINLKANIGKQSNWFSPDGVGNFLNLSHPTNGTQPLSRYLTALFKFGGLLFLNQFNYPTMGLNWFLSDSKISFDSDSILNVTLTYSYTVKMRVGYTNP